MRRIESATPPCPSPSSRSSTPTPSTMSLAFRYRNGQGQEAYCFRSHELSQYSARSLKLSLPARRRPSRTISPRVNVPMLESSPGHELSATGAHGAAVVQVLPLHVVVGQIGRA